MHVYLLSRIFRIQNVVHVYVSECDVVKEKENKSYKYSIGNGRDVKIMAVNCALRNHHTINFRIFVIITMFSCSLCALLHSRFMVEQLSFFCCFS